MPVRYCEFLDSGNLAEANVVEKYNKISLQIK